MSERMREANFVVISSDFLFFLLFLSINYKDKIYIIFQIVLFLQK